MRLVSFYASGVLTPGVLLPVDAAEGAHTHVCDLCAAFEQNGFPGVTTMRRVLEHGVERARQFASASTSATQLAIGTVKLGPPIADPEKVMCVGMNYYEHCTEQNFPIPKEPVLFCKFASSLSGDGDPIPYDTEVTSELDFEVELALIVGKRARRVPAAPPRPRTASPRRRKRWTSRRRRSRRRGAASRKKHPWSRWST